MAWKDEAKRSIDLDNVAAPIASGSAAGNMITLKLMAPSTRKDRHVPCRAGLGRKARST